MKHAYYAARHLLGQMLVVLLASIIGAYNAVFSRGLKLASNTNNTSWFGKPGEIREASTPPLYVTGGIAASTTGWSNRNLLYYLNSSGYLALCGAADKPYCIVENENVLAQASASTLTDPLAATVSPRVMWPGDGLSMVVQASGAIAVGQDVYTAANGQIQVQPNTAGSYWKIGVAYTASTYAGDFIGIVQCEPEAYTVAAAPTITGTPVVTTTPTTSAYGYTLAQAEAIISVLNAVQVDLAALQAAQSVAIGTNLTTPARRVGTVIASGFVAP